MYDKLKETFEAKEIESVNLLPLGILHKIIKWCEQYNFTENHVYDWTRNCTILNNGEYEIIIRREQKDVMLFDKDGMQIDFYRVG